MDAIVNPQVLEELVREVRQQNEKSKNAFRTLQAILAALDVASDGALTPNRLKKENSFRGQYFVFTGTTVRDPQGHWYVLHFEVDIPVNFFPESFGESSKIKCHRLIYGNIHSAFATDEWTSEDLISTAIESINHVLGERDSDANQIVFAGKFGLGTDTWAQDIHALLINAPIPSNLGELGLGWIWMTKGKAGCISWLKDTKKVNDDEKATILKVIDYIELKALEPIANIILTGLSALKNMGDEA